MSARAAKARPGAARVHVSFTITILIAFALVFIVVVGIVVAGYRQTGREAALHTAEFGLAQAAATVSANMRALTQPVLALASVLPELGPLTTAIDPSRPDTASMLSLLKAEPSVQSVSVGLPDGTLRQVARAAGATGQEAPPHPAGTAIMLREAVGGIETWTFLDAQGQVLGRLPPRPSGADPQRSQWYLQASDDAVHVSTLYDLPLAGRPGLSISRRMPSGAVFSLNLTLDALATFLARYRPSPGSVLFVFNDYGMLITHQNPHLAVHANDDGTSSWISLAVSDDPLVRTVWRAFSIGRLQPGRMLEIEQDGVPHLARLEALPGISHDLVLVAVVAPLADFTGPIDAGVRSGTLLAACALLVGLLAIGLVAWRMSRPLAALTHEADAIRQLRLDGPVPVVSRITEIAHLADGMDAMKSALRQFGVYVPRDLVGRLMHEGVAARIGGERRALTVMFSDIDGFTTLAEGIDPEELMQISTAYFEALTNELMAGQGTIDKYIGDAVMALWNAPRDNPAHAADACRAVLTVQGALQALNTRFAARGWPTLRTRFGLHTGDAVVGNVGSADRMSYTAIGSMVNIASRLEGLNKFYGTRILISETTRQAAGPGLVTRAADIVLVKGAQVPMEIHELLGPLPGLPLRRAAEPASLQRWQAMIGHFRAGRFAEAQATIAQLAPADDDTLAALYRHRLDALAAAPPGPDWSPVTRFTTK
jgi:adenylate cyclase